MLPLIIAHRGASGYLPEHTLAAKTLAHEMGADYLEQDIVASRDDELIVLHDIFLDSVTNVAEQFPGRQRDDGRFYVRDFDLAELRELSVWERMKPDGSAVYPDRYPTRSGHFRMNTLAEEIELVQRLNEESGRQAGIYVEIKRPAWHKEQGVDISPALLQLISDQGYGERSDPVFVQCFDPAEVRRLRKELDCPWKLVQLIGENDWQEAEADYPGMLTPEGLAAVAETADSIGPWVRQLYEFTSIDGELVSSGVVEAAHSAGLTVHPYTFRVDDLPEGFTSFGDLVRFCATELNVDGLFTDFPDKTRELLQK